MKIAILLTALPFDGIKARESLDLIFALAAVDHQISVIFSDDAVYQLQSAHDSVELMVKDLRRSFKLFALYDIEQLYVCSSSLQQRKLSTTELVIDAQPLSNTELSELLLNQQHVIKA